MLAFGLLLVAGGFAAASIASGGGVRLLGTTGAAALTGTGSLPSRVTICHHTHSRKHPSHTITISSHAWPAHERHGDTLGPCTQAPTQTGALTRKHGHGNQAPSQVSGAQHGNSDHGNQNGQTNQSNSGEGHGNGNGNGNGHGEGHGHGHP